MKCKKFVALALAGTMTLALASSAFAANTSTKIEGAYEEITIDVSVPQTSKAVINPYGMPFKAIADAETAGKPTRLSEVTTAGKIATNPGVLYNKTEVNLSVGATVNAVVPTTSGVELVSTAVRDTATEKQIQAYLEVKRDNTLDAVTTASDVATASASTICGVDGAKVITAFNNWPTSTYDRTAKNQILITDEETTKENLAIMSAGKKSTPAAASATPTKGSFILFRLGGAVAKNPDEKWAATDTFDVNVAFTFSPVEPLEGGAISADPVAHGNNKLAVAAPTGVTFDSNTTYKWEIVNGGATGADTFDSDTSATPQLQESTGGTASGLSAGDVSLKCTVTLGDGTMYVSTGTVTLT